MKTKSWTPLAVTNPIFMPSTARRSGPSPVLGTWVRTSQAGTAGLAIAQGIAGAASRDRSRQRRDGGALSILMSCGGVEVGHGATDDDGKPGRRLGRVTLGLSY